MKLAIQGGYGQCPRVRLSLRLAEMDSPWIPLVTGSLMQKWYPRVTQKWYNIYRKRMCVYIYMIYIIYIYIYIYIWYIWYIYIYILYILHNLLPERVYHLPNAALKESLVLSSLLSLDELLPGHLLWCSPSYPQAQSSWTWRLSGRGVGIHAPGWGIWFFVFCMCACTHSAVLEVVQQWGMMVFSRPKLLINRLRFSDDAKLEWSKKSRQNHPEFSMIFHNFLDQPITGYPLVMTNIAMENHHF